MSKLGGKVFSEDTDKDTAGGQVDSVVAGTNIDNIDNTDPTNPIINASAAAGSPTTTKGDLIKRGASADERLAVGSALEVLRVNAAGDDLEYAAPAGGGTLTTKGDLESFTTAQVRLPVGTNDQILTADSAASAGVAWKAAPGGDPLTTKGDLFGFNTDAARIPVGTNGQHLEADSTQALGLKWATPAAGGGGAVTAIETTRVKGTTVSTSSNALKGGIYTIDTTFKLHKISVFLVGDGSAATYEVRVFEVSGATKVMDVLVGTSGSVSVAANKDVEAQFVFSTALTITSGKEVAFCIIRTNGTGSSPVKMSFNATEVDAIPPFMTFVQFAVKADNDPLVTEALGSQSAGNAAGMTLFVE